MNLKFLGDALDHWKGSLFERLTATGVLHGLAIDRMASDAAAWQPQDVQLFASLLRVGPSQIIAHQSALRDRSAYFAELRHVTDLFVDPDTGIFTGRGRATPEHISANEIGSLLDVAPGRIVAVYQHVRAKKVSVRVDEVLAHVRDEVGAFSWTSYESATVAMLFLSRTPARARQVLEACNAILGRHAAGRVRSA